MISVLNIPGLSGCSSFKSGAERTFCTGCGLTAPSSPSPSPRQPPPPPSRQLLGNEEGSRLSTEVVRGCGGMRAGPYWESANWACLFIRPGGTASFAVSGVFAVLVRGQVAHKRVETGQKNRICKRPKTGGRPGEAAGVVQFHWTNSS